MLQRSADGLFALASLVRMLFTHEQSMCRFAVARPVYRALRTQGYSVHAGFSRCLVI